MHVFTGEDKAFSTTKLQITRRQQVLPLFRVPTAAGFGELTKGSQGFILAFLLSVFSVPTAVVI